MCVCFVMKIIPNFDKLTYAERMRIAIQLARTYRRLNRPDDCSIWLIHNFISQLKIEGLTEDEIRYAIKRAYMKRVRKYECNEQYPSQ